MKTGLAPLLAAAAVVLPVPHQRPRRLLARHILRISRVVGDLDRAQEFYRSALAFRTVARGPVDPRVLAALGLGDAAAEEIVMRLGAEDIALVKFAPPGRPYPADSRSSDLWFQHLAIVVRDMDRAYTQLSSQGGWQPISQDGPQLLPPSNGGVRAFKFRDPDGHPLELIWFPPRQGRPVWHQDDTGGPFLGIDHSAISVASTARNGRFYRALGFHVVGRSVNRGAAQSRLDGLPDAAVRVTQLRLGSASGPGIELLRYRPPGRPAPMLRPADIAADWITLAVASAPLESPRAVLSPDGHLLVLVGQGAGALEAPA